MAKARKSPSSRSKNGPTIEALRAYVRARGAEFLHDPNVTSIGIGQQDDGSYCLRFTVEQKVDREDVTALEGLGTRLLPETIDVAGAAVPTEVVQRRFRPTYELLEAPTKDARKRRQDPLVAGISVSHPSGTAGTLGLIVYDVNGGAPCILSNWHVLHTAEGALGDPVVQPGPYDDDRVDLNQAGVLVRSHLGVAGDCAIARIEGRQVDPGVLDLGVKVGRLARAELGDVVVKSGRTTAVTRGVVRRVDVMAKITYAGKGEVVIGAFEIGIPPGEKPDYEVSMGGDSGSAWLATKEGKPTDIMVGLHFAGEGPNQADEHALACYAHAVFEKLEISPRPAGEGEPEVTGGGYNDKFLGPKVPVPSLGAKAKDAVKLGGSSLIPYTHFSVCQSKTHHLPLFVAWNIDGSSLKALSRKSMRFRRDPRLAASLQVGDELYADNKLDRGHVARRADLLWGPTAEAKRANSDSFFFTNITPQHEAFNQSERTGLWGQLENAIFEDTDVQNLRVSLLGGPVFRDDDPEYRHVRIPRSFWKVVVYVDQEDATLKAKAYVLSQRDLLDDIEAFELEPFRMYQVSIPRLQGTTGFDFGPTLRKADAFVEGEGPEALATGIREIRSREDITR
jgi:endonuclease G